MKSKLNDAELIAEAYSNVEPLEEGLGALVAVSRVARERAVGNSTLWAGVLGGCSCADYAHSVHTVVFFWLGIV